MELDLLQVFSGFVAGLFVGIATILLFNKLRSGSASPSSVKQEFDDYKSQVESHFEETSKKFQDMTEHYQDLYKHLSTGATSLCRPDSVAATLVENSTVETTPLLQSDTKMEDKNVIETEEKEAVSQSDNALQDSQEAGDEGEADVAENTMDHNPATENSDSAKRD